MAAPGQDPHRDLGGLRRGLRVPGAIAYQSTFLTSYYNFILFLLYLLVPWTSINLVDFYLVRHGHYDVPSFFRQDGGEYGRFQWQTVRST